MKITRRQLRKLIETASGRRAARASMYRTQRKNMGYNVDEEDRLQDLYPDIDDYFDGGYDEEEREWIVYDEVEGKFVPSGVREKGPIGKLKAYHNVNSRESRQFKGQQMAAAMMELRQFIREQVESEYYKELKGKTSDKGQIIGKSKEYSSILLDQMDNFINGLESDYFGIGEISFTAYHELKNAVTNKIETLKLPEEPGL